MNLYHLVRPGLFRLDPELAHHFILKTLAVAVHSGLIRHPRQSPDCGSANIMGLKFPNRVGLAAGLDKNGDYIDALATLGFGFLEIGTVTPRAQPGNPRPRLFRIPEAEAIINRMGFNNRGADYLIERVKTCRYRGILGINIGKNFDTPIGEAAQDYLACMRKVYPCASYITVNVSSPNTRNLRDLQRPEPLGRLLQSLKQEQAGLCDRHGKYVPLVVKIAPDLSDEQIRALAFELLEHRIDGVIATNTTLDRGRVKGLRHAEEAGGLSGKPLFDRSTHVVACLSGLLKDRIPVIASGGILAPEDALRKKAAGASLVQLYSGLVYNGPELIADTVAALNDAG